MDETLKLSTPGLPPSKDIMLPFTCRRCHTRIADIIKRDNAFLLDFGASIASNFVGVCKCGQPLYWNVNVQALQALLSDLGLEVTLDQLDLPHSEGESL